VDFDYQYSVYISQPAVLIEINSSGERVNQSLKNLYSAINLMLESFSPTVMLLSPRVGIRDANRPERSVLSLDDQTECGALNLVAREDLRRVPESLGPG
jgi:hypothetical protein